MSDAAKRNRRKILKETVQRSCKAHGGYVNTKNALEVQFLAERIVLDLEQVATITLGGESEARKTASREPALAA